MPRITSQSRIGAPVSFVRGPFAGRTLRADICEIQKADLGRKWVVLVLYRDWGSSAITFSLRCGRKDRRSLDPPPIVLLKLFELRMPGTKDQVEIELTPESVVVPLNHELYKLSILHS